MKQQIALCAAAVILGFTPSGPLLAQGMPAPYSGPGYPGPGYPGPGYPGALGGLPPYEIVAIVRSRGLEPLSRPVRQGPAYVLRAADPSGRLMLVFVDARMGRIVRVTPTVRPDAIAAPPYPVPPGRMLPDGNGPNSRIAGFPSAPEELAPQDERGPVPPGAPGSAAAAPGRPSAKASPPPSSPPLSPPLPRPRPKIASTSPAAPAANAAPSAPAVAPASAASASADHAAPPFEMDE